MECTTVGLEATMITSPSTSSVVTDAEGYYLICNVDALNKEYTVIVTKEGYIQSEVSVTPSIDYIISADIVIKKVP